MKYLMYFILLWGLFATTQAKELLWSDTHLHTSNSFDAFLNGNLSADPDVTVKTWASDTTGLTFPGAETSAANLHRVVVTDADGETGASFVAIPHNSKLSKGAMPADVTLRGEPINASYAAQRMKWEPIVEATQIKGDSETHPDLSPRDEFADFERYAYYLQQEPTTNYIAHKGDFVRSALREGLRLANELGQNPFQFGLIGSTDSHTGLASAEEPAEGPSIIQERAYTSPIWYTP